MKKYILIFFLLPTAIFGQWGVMNSEADSLVRTGAEHIYNVEFDSARSCFRRVIKSYPTNPAGYFLDAMVEWWKIALYRRTYKYDDVFLDKIQRVIEVCNQRLDSNRFDIAALFFKGGAIGYRGRFHTVRENWVSAARDGKKAFDILTQCHKLAPRNHDIMLGTGIYNYFAEAIPEKYPLVNPVLLFLPSGDKKLGILQLKAASRYARYASVEAEVVLLQIYYTFEDDASKALKISRELHNRYPNNPYFHRYYGRCLVKRGSTHAMEKQWRTVVRRCLNKWRGYDHLTAREALYYVGTALMWQGKYETALKYLYKCDEACRALDRDGPSGFMIRTNLKIGMILDAQGKRKYAIKQYEKVLEWEDYRDSHRRAEQYLEDPYGH
jgi:tetratricopeptide (TPR) repeat protein